MTDKEKIRAEIKRRYKECKGATPATEYQELLDFIDSMQAEPQSEDMWEASKQYALRQVFASTDAVMTEQAYLSLKLFSGFEIAVAHKDGANWQKQKDKSKVLYLPNDSSHPAGKRCLNLSKLSDNDIEYIRKDAFIEKAAGWLLDTLSNTDFYENEIELMIKEFKKAMKL